VRTIRYQQIADELRPKLASIPGALAFPLNPPSLGQSFRSTPIEFVIMSQVPYAELQRIVDRPLRVTILEASGGVSPETVASIAATGVDRVSSGWPTHGAPWLDVALDWERATRS
jgi:pentose-5-phosphate-3-epimerase